MRMTQTLGTVFVSSALLAGALAACSTTPQSETKREALSIDTKAFVERTRKTDPTLDKFFDNCVGYAAFPSIGKGGFIVGGAYGRGQAFNKDGSLAGYCDVSQGSIGAQIGGQSFGEIVFFETKESFNAFKGGQFALAAQASAVAVKAGAGAAAKYEQGVALFIMNPEGLMLEASVGGQQFSFQSKGDVN
jgi:lipid-binding SYLF domain-containing protein